MNKSIIGYGIWIFALLLLGQTAQAQYGFGTKSPSKAAVIEMQSSDKGLLIPRVALTSTDLLSPITDASGTAETNSLLVYNTATTTGTNAVTPGFYYWVTSETRWKRIVAQDDLPTDHLVIADGQVTHTAVDGDAQDFRIVRRGTGDPNSISPALAATAGDMYVDDATGDIYTFNGSAWIQKTGKAPKFFYMPSVIFNTTQTGNSLTRDLYADYVNQFQGNLMNMADGFTDGMSYTGGLIGSAGAPTQIETYAPDELYYYISYYDQSVFDILSIGANGLLTYNIKGNSTDLSYMTIIFVVK